MTPPRGDAAVTGQIAPCCHLFVPPAMSETSTHISVVIPVLNEVESLPELHAKLTTTLSALSDAYELIYIDDGSTDNSAAWMRNMAAQDAHVVPLIFRRHYGKSAALAVGFQRAAGEYVITIDADLQDDPAEIPHLLEKLKEGFDLVSGWKRKRHDPWTKRLPSKIFNFVNKKVFGLERQNYRKNSLMPCVKKDYFLMWRFLR